MSKGKPPSTYDELERYLPYLVNRLASVGQSVQNQALQERGINLVFLRTLSVLNIENGLTINEISARIFAEQSSTSRAIDAMVSLNLVERRIPEHDQRRREIMLTDHGRRQLRESWPAMERYFAQLVDGISTEDREVCRSVLARMAANLAHLKA
jgi:DNA-binding MarR family transcriptional regulator